MPLQEGRSSKAITYLIIYGQVYDNGQYSVSYLLKRVRRSF